MSQAGPKPNSWPEDMPPNRNLVKIDIFSLRLPFKKALAVSASEPKILIFGQERLLYLPCHGSLKVAGAMRCRPAR